MSADMTNDSNNRSDTGAAETGTTDREYKVGPRRPPKEHQFKPGQSGNPNGRKRKPRSVAMDLKALLGSALNKKITLRQGQKERIVTMAEVVSAGRFLLENEAINGLNLVVDGGWMCM